MEQSWSDGVPSVLVMGRQRGGSVVLSCKYLVITVSGQCRYGAVPARFALFRRHSLFSTPA